MKDSKEMMERVQGGKFVIRDFYSQMQSVLKMGPMGKVMSMIPGLGDIGMTEGMEKVGVARMKRFIVIMDSLTPEELDSNKPFDITTNSARLKRICRGSGSQENQVLEMFEEYKKVQKMILGMMGGKSGRGANDPGQMMKKLTQSMDPQMLAQMGGSGNLFNMMKDFEMNDDMMGMMKQMGGGKAGKTRRK